MSDREPGLDLDIDAERVREEHMARVDPWAHVAYLAMVVLGATLLMLALLGLVETM